MVTEKANCTRGFYGILSPIFLPGPVPDGGYDGARLRHDRRDLALLLRLHRRAQPGGQDRHHLPAVLGTTLVTVPLRLR